MTLSGFRQVKSTGTAPGPNNVMEHVAMQESLDGKHVEWLEKVSDEQYAGG